MNEAPEAAQPTTSAPQPARRSRWQRFSPSMGWPAFWSEILIVVLGVVIALAANEAVEDWNWRHKVEDAPIRSGCSSGAPSNSPPIPASTRNWIALPPM